MVEPFPLIEISGAPRERGRQYGRQAADRIRKGTSHYVAQLKDLSLDRDGIASLVRDYLPVIEAFEPAYIEEMRGIAEGAVSLVRGRRAVECADRDPQACKAGSTRAPRPRRKTRTAAPASSCCPQASQAGRLIHAQNWDWKRECAETAVVLKVRRDDGPDLLTFTEAGALGRCGFNAVGIAITANYLESDRDYRQVGVPLALIRRKVLESEHLAIAMRTVYCTQKSAANNMIVSHREGVAIDFECAPDETFPVHPERGLLVHANHFVSPVALGKLKDTGILNTPDSLYRDIRVRGAASAADRRHHARHGQSRVVRRFREPVVGVPAAAPQSQQQSQRHGRDDRDGAGARHHGSGAAAGTEPAVHDLSARCFAARLRTRTR